MGPWEEEVATYRANGFNDEDIFQEQQRQRKEMFDSGASAVDIDKHFGVKQFNPKPVKDHFEENIQRHADEVAAKAAEGPPIQPMAEPLGVNDHHARAADSFIDALQAGWQMSVTGLVARGKAPDIMISEDAGMFYRIAAQIGTLAGDIPAMMAGGVAGGLSGAAAGGAIGAPTGPADIGFAAVGAAIGSGAGSFALPMGMRKILMDHYEKGDVKDFGDFWERASAAFIEAAKGGVIGGATAGVGGYVGKLFAPVAGEVATPIVNGLLGTTARTASEVATMVTVGKAIEGQMPQPIDFLEAGILVAGMHGSSELAKLALPKTLRQIYADTGVKPANAAEEMNKNPVLKQEVLSNNPDHKVINDELNRQKTPDVHPEITSSETEIETAQKTVDEAKASLETERAKESPDPEKIKKLTAELDAATKELGSAEVASEKIKEQFGPTPPPELPSAKLEKEQPQGSLPGEKPVEASSQTKGGRPDAVDRMKSRIVEETPKGKEGYTFRKWYKDFVDRLDPISEAMKVMGLDPKKLPTYMNPYNLARMANDYLAKVKHVYENGTLDYATLQKIGDGFKTIVQPFKNEMADLDAYLLSRKIVSMEGRLDSNGKPMKSGFDINDARATIEWGNSRYKAVADKLTKFSNDNLAYLRDSKRISEEQFQAMVKADQNFIPLKRIFLDEEGNQSAKGGKAGFLNRLKGVGDDSTDSLAKSPLKTILSNTESIYKMAEKNRAMSALREVIMSKPDQTLFEKVDAETRVVELSQEEMQKHFDSLGIDADAKAMKAFRKQGKLTLSDNEFEIWHEGKREIWSTTKDVAEAIKSLDGDKGATNILFKIANQITQFKKLGTTFTPEFIIKNFLRDQLTAGTFAAVKGLPIIDTLYAMGDIFHKNDTYYNWLKAGGAGGSFLDLDANYISKDVFGLDKQVGFIDSKFNVVKSAADFMKAAGAITEHATRLAEYKRIAADAPVSDGSQSGPKVFEGGFGSREVTVDFQRMGAQMSALNAITAFQNVSIQGLDRTIRAVKDNPTSVVKGASLITTASVALFMANHDQDWYKELNRWEKDIYWHMKVGDTVYRFPKPQELGVLFGTLPERVLEAFMGHDGNAFKDFQQTIGQLITPSFIPDIAGTPMEHFTNRSFFTGNPIVSQSAEKLLPEYQYTDYTTESAKVIGRLIGYLPAIRDIGPNDAKLNSPMVVENYAKGWAGAWGMYTLQLLDKALTVSGVVKDLKPESTLADIPFVKGFVSRYPSATAQSIKDFRENFREASVVANTVKTLAKRGQANEMQSVMNAHQDDMVKLTGINEGMTNIGHAIQMVYLNPDYSKSDKRQLIDTLYFQMISLARTGNDAANAYKKAIKQQQSLQP